MSYVPPAHVLGAGLRRWRLLNQVKQAALAADLGVSQGTVSKWESGALVPDGREAKAAADLLTARPRSSADRALATLVREAAAPMHLICDLTHRLLAASPARVAEWRVAEAELTGESLWRFASEGIAAGEAGLEARGWYAPLAPDVGVETERAEFEELTIRQGTILYARLPLSDGGFARLVRDGPRRGAAA